MTFAALVLTIACCTGSYATSWVSSEENAPGGAGYPQEVSMSVTIRENELGGSYAAVPGPAPDFGGTSCPGVAGCYDVTDSFANRGRAFVSSVGTAGQVAVRFEVDHVETPDRIGSFFWERTFVLDPVRPGEAHATDGRFRWPASCRPGGEVECVLAQHEEEDRTLNEAYRRAQERLSTGAFRRLRVRQRQWIRDRDAVCRSARVASAPWAAELAENLCLFDQTQRRVHVLRRWR